MLRTSFFIFSVLSLLAGKVAAQASEKQVDDLIAHVQTFSIDETDSTEFYLKKIRKVTSALKSDKQLMRYYILQGAHFEHQNQYDSSLVYYNKVLRKAKQKSGLRKYEGLAYSYLAYLYQHISNHAKALQFLLKAIEISTELKDPELYYDYSTLGSLYENLEQDSLALLAFEKGAALSPGTNPMYKIAVNSTLFNLYLDNKDTLKAQKMQDEVKKWLDDPEIFDDYNKMIWHLNQSKYYTLVDSLDQAFQMLELAGTLVNEIGGAELKMYLNGYYSEYYEKRGDFNNALLAIKKYQSIKDSLEGIEVQNNVNELQTKYETADKERKISEQALVLQRSDTRQKVLLIFLSGIVIITLLLIYFYINSRKKRMLLRKQNALITQAHKDIKNLMRESHHRIKNNLQVISSLLKMQSKSVDSIEAKASLVEAFNRIKTIALLHQKLQGTDNFNEINLKEFLNQLISAIKASMSINQNIRFMAEIESINMDTDKAISLGLIVNELLTNTLKYAFNDGEKGTVEIVVKLEKGLLHLSIADNGKGLPANFEIDKLTSLGFKIVRSMAMKLKANLQAQNNNGAVVQLNMPYERVA